MYLSQTNQQTHKKAAAAVLVVLGFLYTLLPVARVHAQDAVAPANSGVPAGQPDPAQQQQQDQTPLAGLDIVLSITGGEDTSAGTIGADGSQVETPTADGSDQGQIQNLLNASDDNNPQDQDSIVNDSVADLLPELPDTEVDNEDNAQQDEADQHGSSLDDSLPDQGDQDNQGNQESNTDNSDDQQSADQGAPTDQIDINTDGSVDTTNSVSDN